MEFLCDFTIEILLSFRLEIGIQSAATKSCTLRKTIVQISILLMMINVDSSLERFLFY